MKQHQLQKDQYSRFRHQESVILTSLMTQVSMLEFYIAKIESYMRRKHESILKVNDIEISSAGDASDRDDNLSTKGSSQNMLDLERQGTDITQSDKKIFDYREQITQSQDDDDFERQKRSSDRSGDGLLAKQQDNVKPSDADDASHEGADLDRDLEFYDQI